MTSHISHVLICHAMDLQHFSFFNKWAYCCKLAAHYEILLQRKQVI